MAESRDAPALSARGSGVQNVIDGWVWRQIGKSSAPRHRKHSDNRDHLLSAQRSAVARTHRSGRSFALGVENRLHWILNAVMHEDKTRNRNDNSAYNLAILRHMALNLIARGCRCAANSTSPLGRTNSLPNCFRQFEKEAKTQNVD
jgi:hypothetical protein